MRAVCSGADLALQSPPTCPVALSFLAAPAACANVATTCTTCVAALSADMCAAGLDVANESLVQVRIGKTFIESRKHDWPPSPCRHSGPSLNED